jgi:hypothetical protein
MANSNLTNAKKAKNDEFYTQYHDIEKEINAYLDFNPEVFKGKTILLPCDDPEWSNFTKFFAQNFERFGLKKLISTSYAAESKLYKSAYQVSMFEEAAAHYDVKKTKKHGKIFTLDRDKSGDGKIDINDLDWKYLEGDGDFKSKEVMKLRDEADIIITNPPFSLFRDFLAWIVEAEKDFVIIGNMNAITYKEVFPMIKANKLWLGATGNGSDMVFAVPEGTEVSEKDKLKAKRLGYIGDYTRLGNSCWFTTIDHGRRHQPIPLMTEEDIIKFGTKKPFDVYDNYEAIDISYVKYIPSDYKGVMGVPITFLDKYSPEQFEILGLTKTWFGSATKIYPQQIQVNSNGKRSTVTKLNDGATIELSSPPNDQTFYIVDNKNYIQVYARVLIKHKNPTP